MLTKNEIIEKFGKHDGHDNARYYFAVELSGIINKPVLVCFESLIILENTEFVKLVDDDEN